MKKREERNAITEDPTAAQPLLCSSTPCNQTDINNKNTKEKKWQKWQGIEKTHTTFKKKTVVLLNYDILFDKIDKCRYCRVGVK